MRYKTWQRMQIYARSRGKHDAVLYGNDAELTPCEFNSHFLSRNASIPPWKLVTRYKIWQRMQIYARSRGKHDAVLYGNDAELTPGLRPIVGGERGKGGRVQPPTPSKLAGTYAGQVAGIVANRTTCGRFLSRKTGRAAHGELSESMSFKIQLAMDIY